MQRRNFIKSTALGIVGISCSSLLFNCSKERFSLKAIIGQPEKLSESFKKEGDTNFAYYTIKHSSFEHKLVSGECVFIFCKENKIVGFTIRQDTTVKSKKYTAKLSEFYNDTELIYDNEFGKKYRWQNSNREFNLSYTKDFPNLSQYTFYSESILNHGLIVF